MNNYQRSPVETLVCLFAIASLVVSASPFCAHAADCISPPSGLVGWWRAEGIPTDEIGGNHGTAGGGLAYGQGQVGQAFVFNGAGAVVDFGNPTNLQLQTFTIEAWIKRASTSTVSLNGNGNGVIFGYGIGGYGVYLAPGGYPALTHVGVDNVTLGTAITDTNFHHLAVTKSGGTVLFYVDGVSYSVPAYNPSFTFSTTAAIGGIANQYTFLGSIDELAFYNRALSGAEIQSIFDAGTAGKCFVPTAPTITSQPTNLTVVAGDPATFTVVATGSSPLSYQWRLNETNIAGATASSLYLPQAQPSDVGLYSVVVSNSVAAIISSNALLTVSPAPPCATPPSGLVSWWRAEGDAFDATGGNQGTLSGGVAFAPGQVGQAFVFNGNGSVIQLGSAPNLQLQDFSIEAWIKRASTMAVSLNGNGNGHIFGYGIGGYGVYLDPSGRPALTKAGINNVTLGTAITDTNYHHLAVTKSGGTVVFYIDGVAYNVPPYNPGFTFSTPAAIGGIGPDYTFWGSVDELSFFNRPLAPTEVQSIFNARSAGKCVVPIPPFLGVQPTNRTVTVGANVTFAASAGGSVPLSYQWQFNGTNLDGATASSLTISNVQFSQSGNYSVVVTNNVSTTTSSNALLTVVFPPAKMRVVSTTGMAGGTVTVPVHLVANGNENALGFSLNFSTQRLVFSSVTLGAGASNATPLFNTADVSKGRLGVALALPLDATLAPGTQEVVRVEFTSAVLQSSSPVTTTITFGDQPTVRQLSDPQALPLSANYSNGVVTLLPTDLEGDVSPRPTGDRTNAITDWVQVGRFAARLDIAAAGSEFQRADCAPRSNLGNGDINVVDWVQAGRYAAGLDPLTAVGGPSFAGSSIGGAGRSYPQGGGSARKVRVGNTTGVQGLTLVLPVTLESQGDENALGFSLSFDPSKFSYVGTTLGNAVSGGTLNVNTAQIGSGKVGVALMLPIGGSFGAGTREVAKVSLVPTVAAVGDNPVGFSNSPVSCVVSDPFAIELTADYVTGSISVNPLPALIITRSAGDVKLTWPVWAATFNLQTAESTVAGGWTNVVAPLQTNGSSVVVTVPVAGETKYFRLYHP